MYEGNPDERVLVLAPVGQDARVMADLLTGRGMDAQVCSDMAECCACIRMGAGALALTEEALELPNAADLFDVLIAQPTWSELPLIILTTGGESRLARLLNLAASAAGSVTLLERPIGTTTLLRSLEAALNSRRRQYQVRDLIAEQERRRRELEQAEEQSARLAAIVTSSADPILSKTQEGIVTSWNAAAQQMFGYTAQEMIGQPILRLIPPERQGEEGEILSRLKKGEGIEHYETVRVAKDGRHVDVSLTISPIKDSAGRIIGASKIIHDITKRKQAENELREAHAQLADRARHLESLVQLRTAHLAHSNEQLRREIAERQQAEATREALRRQLLNAQEEERRRIARELHDQMGQNLTALNFGLKSLFDAAAGHEPLRQMLPPLQELAAQTARDLHRVALELRPAALDDLGLVKAVRNLVDTWSARSRIEADFEAGRYDPAGISSETETTLYRVMQEALNNIAKHAEARHVSLVLHRGDGHVQAIIEDDGRGFDAASALNAPNGRRRLGLVGIKERLAMAGGSLQIESAPGSGTSLRVRIPVSKPA